MLKPSARLSGILLLASLTALVYANSINAQFQFDDYHQIVRNEGIRQLSNIPKFFISIGLGSEHFWGTGYRPLTYSSFAINYAISGNDPWSYHIFNLLLHVINSLLVYLVLKRALYTSGEDATRSNALSWAAALIFAVHPAQTNTVTYISGRAVLLSAMFGLLSFYFFLRYRESDRGAKWGGLTVLSFVLALLSKEIAACIPVLMVLYGLFFPRRDKQTKAGLALFASLALALVAYLAVRKFLTGSITAPPAPYGRFSYLLSEVKAALLYLRVMLLPINLNADYNLPLTESVNIRSAVAVLLVTAFGTALLMLRRRLPLTAFFGLWWFIALAPEALIVPIKDLAVEYRMYLPSVGLIASAVVAEDALIKNRAALKASFVAVVLMLAVMTVARNDVWKTGSSLWSDVVRKSPGSIRAYANYGDALYSEGRYKEAVVELQHAVMLDPLNPDQAYALNNLGLCYRKLGLQSEAESAFRNALMLEPDIEDPYINLSTLYHAQGRYAEEADVLRSLLRVNPGSAVGRRNLAEAERMEKMH